MRAFVVFAKLRYMSKSKKNKVRLPKHVKPERYKIFIKPDLKTFKYEAEETISLELFKSDSQIVLHSKSLVIESAEYFAFGRKYKPKAIKYDTSLEQVIFSFKKKLPKGRGELGIKFNGLLEDRLNGFYRSSYEHEGKIQHIATTQFESTFARNAFPCFDEPSAKAIFDVTLMVQKGLHAISNTLPIGIQEHQGWDIVQFAPTPKMSTYLLAFIVGNFEFIEGKTKNNVLVRVFVTPGKKKQAKFALDVAIKSLDFYEQYFDIKYPLPVLDMIALPDFSAAAMENWGAVTYRETALLIDPDHSPVANKQQVALTITHELAHQWFGNLVTMEWWTDLWLNEGFASYIEHLALNHIFPSWKVWDQFVFNYQGLALSLDALKNTHPIEVEVHHPTEIDEIFDTISYSKGASIIRMLANYLGEKDFRNGLRHYLKKHAYGNAITEDLWHAFEKVSGKKIAPMMRTWTKQAGYPVISVETKDAKGKIHVSQERFFSSSVSRKENKKKTLWKVPVSIFRNKTKTENILLEKESLTTKPLQKGEWLKLNLNETGFYRVKYQPAFLNDLKEAILKKKLDPKDRLALISNAFALAQAGYIPTTEALKLLEAYKNEDNYNVWVEISSGLAHLSRILENEDFKETFEKYCRDTFSPMVSKVDWSKKSQETHTQSLLRSLILANAVRYKDQKTTTKALVMFKDLLRGKHIDPDIKQIVYLAVAINGGVKEYKQLRKLYRHSKLHEEKHRIARVLPLFKDQRILADVLKFFLSKEVRNQDTTLFLASALSSRRSKHLAWKFVKKNWKYLLKKFGGGGHEFPRITGALEVFVTEKAALDISEFFKVNSAPGAERSIQQSIEQIRSNAAWIKKDREILFEYFKK